MPGDRGKEDRVTAVAGLQPRFGEFGGRYIPETLVAAHEELEAAYDEARRDPRFAEELEYLYKHYVGRPTPLYFAEAADPRMRRRAHLAEARRPRPHRRPQDQQRPRARRSSQRRLGKTRIIAETGAGQHGVATATVCAMLGLECVVYMGSEDIRRQRSMSSG
nr:hypothetical protein [Tepidiforma sp.]